MNEDKMELEEAIKELESLSPSETAIETVLQELEKLQEENRILKNRQNIESCKEVNVENLSEVLSPYYIPKKKIENLLEEVYTDEGIGYELDKDEKPGAVRVLRELLEDKK